MKVITSDGQSASYLMQHDAELLSNLEGEPLVHLYSFRSPSATYGYFLNPDRLFNMQEVHSRGLDLARRPTGGGVIFHAVDFTFSFLIPACHASFSLNPLDNYFFINRLVQETVEATLSLKVELLPKNSISTREAEPFCMANPTKYDLLVRGKKMGGAAQRKTKKGYLHQGSLLLGQLSCAYLAAIIKEKSVVDGIYANSFAPLGNHWTEEELADLRASLRQNLKYTVEKYA